MITTAISNLVSPGDLVILVLTPLSLLFLLFRADRWLMPKAELGYEFGIGVIGLAYAFTFFLFYGIQFLFVFPVALLGTIVGLSLFVSPRRYIYHISFLFLISVPLFLLLGFREITAYLSSAGVFSLCILVCREVFRDKFFA